MSNYNKFGDVISSNLKLTGYTDAKSMMRNDFQLYVGQIEKIYPIDSPEIQSPDLKKYVLYDVRVKNTTGSLELITHCRMLQPGFGGGINNFLEVVPTNPGPSAQDFQKNQDIKPGHYVLVGLIGGQRRSGVILGSMPHANPVASKKRPKKAKGVHTEGEIQGLNFQISNDGELQITFNGPRKDDGSLVKADVGPTSIQIDKSGNLKVSTNANQSVSIDRTTKKITVTNGPTSLTMDQQKDQIDVVAKRVNVGKGALQHQVVGDDLVKFLKELISEITKIYVPTGVGPSGTPINTPKFKQLENKVEQMILSTKHWVEKK